MHEQLTIPRPDVGSVSPWRPLVKNVRRTGRENRDRREAVDPEGTPHGELIDDRSVMDR
ncbi:hypothetical protein [Halorubrum sp. F4]|uniref:hypothetical protein n=1 Tax=Halorubrum sp. F4 TaxID=2989715 RepID=UPI00247FE860|nr:hypothetical protein [Halorubrum sp. F4]